MTDEHDSEDRSTWGCDRNLGCQLPYGHGGDCEPWPSRKETR